MKKSFIFSACTLFSIGLVLCGCGGRRPHNSYEVHGLSDKVKEIVSGNEIKLANGLTVELLGFEPNAETKKYLEENVKGQTVEIQADSKSTTKTLSSYDAKVKAYARLGHGYCISGTLLRSWKRYGTSLKTTDVNDSLKVFENYIVSGRLKPMSQEELRSYLLPRTFYIAVRDSEGNEGHGTGFFIDENGLALTNNHVLNENTADARICYLNDDGTLETNHVRNVKRIAYTYMDEDEPSIDFTIFYVDLDPGEKSPYMPLVKEQERPGTQLAKMGCPADEVANFKANGELDLYKNGYFTHGLNTYSGDSGSPIVNFRGEVVGINRGTSLNVVQDEITGEIRADRVPVHQAVDATLIRSVLNELGIDYLH